MRSGPDVVSGAGAGRAAAAGDERGEGRQLALDHADRVAVDADEVDGEQDDQRDLDGLGDVGGRKYGPWTAQPTMAWQRSR